MASLARSSSFRVPRRGRVWSGSPLRTTSPSDLCIFRPGEVEGPPLLPGGVARAGSTGEAMCNLGDKAPVKPAAQVGPHPRGHPGVKPLQRLNLNTPPSDGSPGRRVQRLSTACTPPPDGSPGRMACTPFPPSLTEAGSPLDRGQAKGMNPPPPPSHAPHGAPCRLVAPRAARNTPAAIFLI